MIGLGGVALLVGVESVGSVDELGSLAMLLAAVCCASQSYVVTGACRGFPPIATSAISLAGAAVLTLPLAAATGRHSAPGAGDVAALAALSITHTGLAFAIFYKLIGGLGAGRANLVAYMTPPFALAYGAVFLDERSAGRRSPGWC